MSEHNSDTEPIEEPIEPEEIIEKKPAPRRKKRKRRKSGDLPQLILYIVVNIIVSATTMLVVLFFWDLRMPQNENACVPTIAPTSAVIEEIEEPTIAAIPPLEQEVIQIEVIFGAGYLQDELVVLKRVGTSDLPLYGWWLEDAEGNRFEFPAMTLKPGGTLEVYSRGGDSTVLELYWGADRSVWEVGETASVYDPQGNLRAEYLIP